MTESPPWGLRGRYRDVVRARSGATLRTTGWRCNAIVDGAWSLLAARLRDEPGLGGIRFLAVGAGDAAWDHRAAPALHGATGLVDELRRVPVSREAMRYLDAGGEPAAGPTPELEASVELAWEEEVTLREFGLFGGDASEAAGSGWLVNHVSHPALRLGPGQRLTRTVRLGFRRPVERRWLEVGHHWLEQEPVGVLEGVGPGYEEALRTLGVRSVGELARLAPGRTEEAIPGIRLADLRARARLALRTAAELKAPPELHGRTAGELMAGDDAALAAEAGVDERDVASLREQVAVLEVALDHDVLARLTVGELTGRRR